MPRAIHFEIHAEDPPRAKTFYEKVFAWSFQEWGGGASEYWIITTGAKDAPGIDGGMVRRRGPAPSVGAPVNAFVVTLRVKDVDASLSAAASAGGDVALPKMPIPGVGWLAYIRDTEGNILGMMQDDTGAK